MNRYLMRIEGYFSGWKQFEFDQWTLDKPEQNEFYLVYRIGYVLDIGGWVWKPHYTIRKYHNGSFGSKDVKYWIKLSEVCER